MTRREFLAFTGLGAGAGKTLPGERPEVVEHGFLRFHDYGVEYAIPVTRSGGAEGSREVIQAPSRYLWEPY